MEILHDNEIIGILERAQKITVLTGAGVSAESGIPTFRGEAGLWKKLSTEELASFEGFCKNTALVSEWYQYRRDIIQSCEPNPGHFALAALEDIASDFTLITQNVDGLHQRSGSKNVIELHGNIMENYCINCNQQFSQEEFDEIYRHNPDHVSRCFCGGLIRPNVVWFGEPLPEESIEKAYQASIRSDVFIAVGTSAQVVPASNLPRYAKQNNAFLIEVNTHNTGISDIVDYVIEGPSGNILPKFVEDYKQIKTDS